MREQFLDIIDKMQKNSVMRLVRECTKRIGINRFVYSVLDYSCRKSPTEDMKLVKELYEANKDKIDYVSGMLEDDRSKNVYYSLMQYRVTRDRKYLRGIIESKNQYFPSYEGNPLFCLNDEVFVDCGAYNGDTILKLINQCGAKNIKKIVAFEPDQINARKLYYCRKKYGLNMQIHETGVSDAGGYVSFASDQGINSHIIDENYSGADKIDIRVEAIDECDDCNDATFIKMDIEGAEMAALKGAQDTIRKNHPKLAICIYHKPEDFWDIPIYIKNLYPGYKIYIRHHLYTQSETVCYAVP